jgi:hypothetical protein
LIATTLPEFGKKKAVNFVLLLFIGSGQSKPLFSWLVGVHRAPTPPFTMDVIVIRTEFRCRGSAICVAEPADQMGISPGLRANRTLLDRFQFLLDGAAGRGQTVEFALKRTEFF